MEARPLFKAAPIISQTFDLAESHVINDNRPLLFDLFDRGLRKFPPAVRWACLGVLMSGCPEMKEDPQGTTSEAVSDGTANMSSGSSTGADSTTLLLMTGGDATSATGNIDTTTTDGGTETGATTGMEPLHPCPKEGCGLHGFCGIESKVCECYSGYALNRVTNNCEACADGFTDTQVGPGFLCEDITSPTIVVKSLDGEPVIFPQENPYGMNGNMVLVKASCDLDTKSIQYKIDKQGNGVPVDAANCGKLEEFLVTVPMTSDLFPHDICFTGKDLQGNQSIEGAEGSCVKVI